MKIKISHLCFGYLKRPLSVVDFSCEVKSPSIVSIYGGEGAGKTSLLRVLSGMEKQYAGFIFYDEKNLADIELSQRNFSYIPSDPVLFDNQSIYKNFKFLFDVIGKEFDNDYVVSICNKFDFKFDLKTKMKKLSSADKKVFTLIRSFIKNPDVLFLDDLFINENIENCKKIKNAILLLINEKMASKCVFYVENMQNLLNIGTSIEYLSYGRQYHFDTLEALKNNPVDFFTYSYFKSIISNYNLFFDGNNFYLRAYKNVAVSRKKYENKLLRQIKLSNSFFEILCNQKLTQNQEIEISLASFEEFENLSDEKINDMIKNNKLHIFDKNTFTKII